MYKNVRTILAGLIGICASAIVGTLCNNVIQTQEPGFKRNVMNFGKFGLETATVVEVTQIMNDDIDELVDCYNEVAEVKIEIDEKRKEAN